MGAADGDNTRGANCFKAYDIRGRVPDEINPELAYAIGMACGPTFGAKKAVIGRDARLSGPDLENALAAGLLATGISVDSIGMCGSEEIYYAAANHAYDLGVMITGSHNPADENGFKLVRAGAVPVSGDSGLKDLEKNVREILRARHEAGAVLAANPQDLHNASYRQDYVDWLLSYTGIKNLPPASNLCVVANAGNGCAGLVLGELAPHLPCDLRLIHSRPDGNFPHGVPNPLLPERRQETSAAVLKANATIGVAFDGDFDRCFFYDDKGNFIESYYLVGMLASAMLQTYTGEKIVHDTRVYWNTREQARAAGGIPVMGKTGHAFMKERMRSENAIYGGEMSAHHYFRDFAFCDSGILTMLFVLAATVKNGIPLGKMVEERMAAYPCSGEINFRVADCATAITVLEDRYEIGRAHV